MTIRTQQRNDTAANFTSVNPVLRVGEIGLENDTGLFKFGDGTTVWTGLPYSVSGGASTVEYISLSESTTDTQLGAGTGIGTLTTINFDTEDENTNTDNFSLASNEVTIVEAGNYRIEYMITFQQGSGTSRRQLASHLYVDPNTGTFAIIGETTNYSDLDSNDKQSMIGAVTMNLVADSIIQLRTARNVGTATTISDRFQTSLTITRVTTGTGGGGGGTLEQGIGYPDPANNRLYMTFGADGSWEAIRFTQGAGDATTGAGQTGTKPTDLTTLQGLSYT